MRNGEAGRLFVLRGKNEAARTILILVDMVRMQVVRESNR